MITQQYLKVADVAQLLSISMPKAYAIVRQCNEELKAKGYITVSGRVSAKYFAEKTYCGGIEYNADIQG